MWTATYVRASAGKSNGEKLMRAHTASLAREGDAAAAAACELGSGIRKRFPLD